MGGWVGGWAGGYLCDKHVCRAALLVCQQSCQSSDLPCAAAATSPPTSPATSWCCRPLAAAVILSGQGGTTVLDEGELVFLHSDHPEDENSFDNPTKVGAALRWDALG